MTEAQALRLQAFGCDACASLGLGFERPGPGEPFFKFPPTIGAEGPAPILFVGLNPRRSSTNLHLHDRLMMDPAAFEELAANRVDGRPYVAVDGAERHYRLHARMVAALFPGRPFEEVAAVTELFLCATEGSEEVRRGERRCAERYLRRVVQLVQPSVIVAVGRDVEQHLRPRFGPRTGPFRAVPGGVRVFVVPVRHPNAWGDRGATDEEALSAVAKELGLVPTPLPPPPPTETRHKSASPRQARRSPPLPPARQWPWKLLTELSIVFVWVLACCCRGCS